MAEPAEALSLEVLTDPERAAAALAPRRRELLALLAQGPDSAAGLARRLAAPRQRVNYHLRALEKAGLVELAEERRRGNCVERIVRTTARHYLLDPAAVAGVAADPDTVRDRFSASYLVALAARAIREVATLGKEAARRRQRLATFSLLSEVRLASPAAMGDFVEELAEAVAAVVARHHSEEGGRKGGARSFRLLLAVHPRPAGAGRQADHGGSDEQQPEA